MLLHCGGNGECIIVLFVVNEISYQLMHCTLNEQLVTMKIIVFCLGFMH